MRAISTLTGQMEFCGFEGEDAIMRVVTEDYQPDDFDKAILEQAKAIGLRGEFISLRDLAKLVGRPESTVKARVARLRELGLFTLRRYDCRRLSREQLKVLRQIKLDSPSMTAVRVVAEFEARTGRSLGPEMVRKLLPDLVDLKTPLGSPIPHVCDDTDKAILDASKRIARRGQYPTCRRVGEAIGMGVTAVAYRIKPLVLAHLWSYSARDFLRVASEEIDPETEDRSLFVGESRGRMIRKLERIRRLRERRLLNLNSQRCTDGERAKDGMRDLAREARESARKSRVVCDTESERRVRLGVVR